MHCSKCPQIRFILFVLHSCASLSASTQSTSNVVPHTFTITCTCCYDEIKGAQDQDLFSCSFSESLSASVIPWSPLEVILMRICLVTVYTHPHTLTLTLYLLACCDQQNSRPQDLFSCGFSLCLCHYCVPLISLPFDSLSALPRSLSVFCFKSLNG